MTIWTTLNGAGNTNWTKVGAPYGGTQRSQAPSVIIEGRKNRSSVLILPQKTTTLRHKSRFDVYLAPGKIGFKPNPNGNLSCSSGSPNSDRASVRLVIPKTVVKELKLQPGDYKDVTLYTEGDMVVLPIEELTH